MVKKKLLVLGGSYFAGRVFCMLASRTEDLDIYVVNRGRYILDLPNITEFQSDRHNSEKLQKLLLDLDFDAVIDFCAYEPQDIKLIIDTLNQKIKQYLYISTSSVYNPESHQKRTENSPLTQHFGNDIASQYIAKKAHLETELLNTSNRWGIKTTIIRPTFIYGPYNYAPRESYYIKKIVLGEPIPVATDATAKFNFVYVTDVASVLLMLINDTRAYNKVFNLAAPEDIDYPEFLAELKRCNGAAFATTNVTVKEVLEQNIPLPFPLIDDDLCSGQLLSDTFEFAYTPFAQGMDKTFAAFKSVYS